MLDHVRHLTYFGGDEDVSGDFTEPAFRNKSCWCPEKRRDLVILLITTDARAQSFYLFPKDEIYCFCFFHVEQKLWFENN